MNEGVLVVGYGNVLRSDDGIGRHVAERLADDPRFAGATVIGCHQLTPELALDVSDASLVVLVDASHGPPPGEFTIERLAPDAGVEPRWSHQLGPASLVALARQLYGRAPDTFVVSVGVESVEVGEGLSPVVEAALGGVIDAVAGLLATERDTPPLSQGAAGPSR